MRRRCCHDNDKPIDLHTTHCTQSMKQDSSDVAAIAAQVSRDSDPAAACFTLEQCVARITVFTYV